MSLLDEAKSTMSNIGEITLEKVWRKTLSTRTNLKVLIDKIRQEDDWRTNQDQRVTALESTIFTLSVHVSQLTTQLIIQFERHDDSNHSDDSVDETMSKLQETKLPKVEQVVPALVKQD